MVKTSHSLKITFKNMSVTKDRFCLLPGSSRLQGTQTRPKPHPLLSSSKYHQTPTMYQEHPHVPGTGDKDWAWPNRDAPTQKMQRFNYPEGKPSEPSPTRTPKTTRKKQLQYIIRGLISQPVIPGMVNSYFKIKSNLEHSSIFSTNI